MFKFLKEKIKKTVEKFSSNAEEEVIKEEELTENDVEKLKEEEIKEEKKGFFSKLFSKKEKVEDVSETKESEIISDEKDVKKIDKKPKEEIKEEIIIPEVKKEEIKPLEKKVEVKKEIPTTEKAKEKVEVKEEEKVVQEKKEEVGKKDVEEVNVVEEVKEPQEIVKDEEVVETKETEVKEPILVEVKKEEKIEKKPLKEEIVDATQKKKGFFGSIKDKIFKFKLTDEKFEELFWEFELELMESNVAISVIEKIKENLKEKLTTENISRKNVSDVILESLRETFDDILSVEGFDLIEKIKAKNEKPFIISMIGVNGSGKTTTLAKLIHLFKKENLSVVVAACDTFRAAAIDQIEEHTTKLDVKLIKQDYKSDPAAVAFDAIKHAEAKKIDVVLIDTAGRLHSNTNLMDELKKIIKVSKPDLKIFIGESITGNDCVEQASEFDDLVGIDGIILSKADIDDNGGAAISVSYVTKKPILYLGTGQTYDDLVKFNKNLILKQLFEK